MTQTTKRLTGVRFTPDEFRKLNLCLSCLKASDIPYGTKCESCRDIEFKFCDICECVLREGFHRYYLYDNRDHHRDNGIGFLASKEMVREFVVEKELPPLDPESKICEDCVGWEARMKDICGWCDNDFTNTKEHYKLNGNMCGECALLYPDKPVTK